MIALIAIAGFIGSSPHRGVPLVVLIILLVSLALFYKLTITIEDDTLRVSFSTDDPHRLVEAIRASIT